MLLRRRPLFLFPLVYLSLFVFSNGALAQGPRVLIVDAHPDDETAYAATVYKLTHDFHGHVDLVVITNGEGGFKYSTLAEPYYHRKLTDEAVGRKFLPAIRKKELRAACDIIGIHNIYFLDQWDNHYTKNVHEVLDDTSRAWNLALVRKKLHGLLSSGHYDFVFTLLPTDSTHGHHKAATILALQEVEKLPAAERPIVLGGSDGNKNKPLVPFYQLADYPITRISDSIPRFSFDRTQSFGYNHMLNYKIVINWEIAEHKSQGTMQLGMNQGDFEEFSYYDINPPQGRVKAEALFDKLAINTYPELTYPHLK